MARHGRTPEPVRKTLPERPRAFTVVRFLPLAAGQASRSPPPPVSKVLVHDGWLGADLAGDLQPPSPSVGAGRGRATAESPGQRPLATADHGHPVHVRSHSPNPARETLSVELSPLGSKAHGAALGGARLVTCSRRLQQSHTKAVHAR